MINLKLDDRPVRPAVEGRHRLPGTNMYFTVGEDHVGEKAVELLRRNRTLALDIETFGLGNLRFRIKTVTFADDTDAVILDPRDDYQRHIIKRMIKNLDHIVQHNSMYDTVCLYQTDLLDKSDIDKVFDTIITSRQGSPGEMSRHGLDVLVKKHFGVEAEKKIGSDEFYAIDLDRISFIHGAALDALFTFKLLPILTNEVNNRYTINPSIEGLILSPEEKEYIIGREQRINQILLKSMCRGLSVDLDEVDKYDIEIRPQENRFELIMRQFGMTSFTNRNQLITGLIKADAIPQGYPVTGKNKKPSTAEKDLKHIQHPLAQAFAGHSMIQKVKQYLNTIADESYRTGRVFVTTNLLGAGTGRISMANPPLQQFIPAARPVIVSEDGDEFSSIDWSQVEPCLVIYVSDDTVALQRYEEGEADLYEIVAAIAGIPRKQAKTTLLAQLYGQGLKSLALRLGVSYEQAREYRNRIFAAMPNVAGFIQGMKQMGQNGHIHTLMGRVLDVPRYNGVVKDYVSVNYMVQGSAYDLLAEALIQIDKAGLADGIYFSIHDELIVSTSYADDIAAIMRTPPERITRLLDKKMILGADPSPLGRHWQKI